MWPFPLCRFQPLPPRSNRLLAVIVVTSRLVLPFSRSAVPIVSGALIAFPPSVVLRLLPLHLAATKVVIPRATREAAPVFLIQITFMFDGVDPDGVFLRNATQTHTCSADLLDSSTHVFEGHVKRANAGTSLLTDARETLQPELDVGWRSGTDVQCVNNLSCILPRSRNHR